MKNIIKTILSFILCVVLIFIYGCSNTTTNPITPTTITVNGRFLDIFGNPFSGKTVILGSQSTTTDNNGSFTFNNVSTPYDLFFLYSSSTVTVFKGLTITNPQLPGTNGGTLFPNLTVHIPMVPNGSQATVMYIDTVTGYISGSAQVSSGSDHVSIDLGGNNGQGTAGVVYVLQYNINVNNVITGYTKFGQQSLILTIGSNPTVTFTSQQLTLAPGSSTVSGTVNNQGYPGTQTVLYINFGSKNNLSNIGGTLQIINSTTFTYNVPIGIPIPVSLNVEARVAGFTSQRMLTLTPGTNNAVINLDAASPQTAPPTGANNIDTNTIFTYSSGTGNGIYAIAMYGAAGGKNFTIYTSDVSAKIPNLALYGYPIGSNVQYTWNVIKLLDFSDINNFSSQYYIQNPSLKSGTFSAYSNFTTKP